MSTKQLTFLLTITFWILTTVTSCKEESETLPLLATLGVYNITTASASSGGLISECCNETISERGVCWAVESNPTIELQTKTNDGEGSGSFTSNLENLISGTKYYIRAYAINDVGTAYGNEVSFTTEGSKAELITSEIASLTFESAISGGSISHDGGADITSRGVCWGLYEHPVIEADFYTSDGISTGSFISQLSNLEPGKTYFLRAYAINENGISYGNELNFETLKTLASLKTNDPYDISYHSAKVGGKLLDSGGETIHEMGLCFNTSTQPTIEKNKVINDNGELEFSLVIDNLEPGIKYYVRTFGTNSVGTSYGPEVSFTTLDGDLQIGYFYEGGIIFHIDDSGSQGFICATEDQTSVEWGCRSLSISGTSTDVGTGFENTNAIVSQCNETNSAAKVCADLVFNDYDDWFLPSKDELNLIYLNLYKNGIGNFNDIYRSSSEFNGSSAWTMQFSKGAHYNLWKGSTVGIRAIRSF